MTAHRTVVRTPALEPIRPHGTAAIKHPNRLQPCKLYFSRSPVVRGGCARDYRMGRFHHVDRTRRMVYGCGSTIAVTIAGMASGKTAMAREGGDGLVSRSADVGTAAGVSMIIRSAW